MPDVGEGVIHVPGGVPFEADATPLYPAGSYMRIGGKEFIYAISGGTIRTGQGVKNCLQQIMAYEHVARTYAAGVTEVIIDVQATDGVLGDGAIAKDELKDGSVTFHPHEQNEFTRGIVSNTATVGGSAADEMTIVLDSPTPVAVEIDVTGVECMASPYSAVKYSTNEWYMVMGIATVKATEGQGLWLQVSGISWVAPQDDVGASALDFDCVFRHDGSIEIRDSTTKLHQQHAGCVVATVRGGGGQGNPFFMLQVAH